MRKLLISIAALMVCNNIYAAELFGSVDAISGSAYVTDLQGINSDAFINQNIYAGQTINTASDGEVHIATEDGGVIALRPDSVFRVDEYKADGGSADKIFMSLLKGTIRSITGWIGKHNADAYLITTPTATIGVRGTDHETTVIENAEDEAGTYDTVHEGATLLKSPHGQIEVTPGRFAFAPQTRAAAPSLLARQPNFWARRNLKIEERIQHRKEFLRSRIEELRNERIKRQNTLRAAHQPAQTFERRNEHREDKLNQVSQHREARHLEAQRQHDNREQARHAHPERHREPKPEANGLEEDHRKVKQGHHEKRKAE